MAQKLYLHRNTTTVGGTMPGAGVSISGHTPVAIASGGDTNRVMDTTISAVAQTSIALTTQANTSAQESLIARFVSPQLDGDQAIAQQLGGLTMNCAESESNANSNFHGTLYICIWRPSTGAVVADLYTGGAGAFDASFPLLGEPGTTQTAVSQNFTNQAQNALDGDVIVMEFWRDTTVQGMGTAYTNTLFYDGTVEASTTDCASYLLFTNSFVFKAPAASFQPRPTATLLNDPGLLMKGIKRAWHRRRSGIFAPEYAF